MPESSRTRCFPLRLIFWLSLTTTNAYQQQPPVATRRGWLGMVATSAIAMGSLEAVSPADASQYCAFGMGDDCEDLAEGNEYIKALQAKSAANKDAIQADARNAYYMKNYPDFFSTIGKSMIKKADGTFFVVDEAELKRLTLNNQIALEYPKAMGGKVMDLTQKPIMVLKE